MATLHMPQPRQPWNKGKLVGQKAPLKLKDIWAIRVRLQLCNKVRDLALFNLAIDSKLRGCDLVKLRVPDVTHGSQVASRTTVMQQKTRRPVQFEITSMTRETVQTWIRQAKLTPSDYLFASRVTDSPHLSIRQYARIVRRWVEDASLEPSSYGTHDAEDKGLADLSANPEPESCPTPTRAYQAGEHCALPRDRGRRRPGDC